MLGNSKFAGSSLDSRAILGLLPHRYPMLLVDHVTECVPGVRIRGYKNISQPEPCFAAEKTRSKAMPTYLVIEAMAQMAVILTFRSLGLEPCGKELIFFAGIDDARFSGFSYPGDRLQLDCSIVRLMPTRGIGKFSTVASVGTRELVKATLIAALQLPDRLV